MRASQDAHPIIRGTFVIDEKIENLLLSAAMKKPPCSGGRLLFSVLIAVECGYTTWWCGFRVATSISARDGLQSFPLRPPVTSIAPKAREPIPHALGAFLCFHRRPYEPPSPRRRGEMEAKDKTLPEWSLWPRFLHLATGRGGMRPRRPVRSLGLPPPTRKEGGAHPSNHVEVVPLDAPLAVRD